MVFLSYFLYIGTVLFATFFAYLAQRFAKVNKNKKLTPHPFFYTVSMLSLIFVLGFRDISIGVDGYSYFDNFVTANSMGVIAYYQTYVTEPGFYLLYRVAYLLGDFQWLFIMTAIITIYLFYKAVGYETEKINLALAIFILASTQYFYYFGIMRMGIAVAIIAYSYRYIIEGKKLKFIFLVLIASMFHYSALFALILVLFSKNKFNKFKKTNLIKIIIFIPLSFFAVRLLIFPLITANRYQNYIEDFGVISLDFVSSLPLLILFLLYFNKFSLKSDNYQFYLFLFVVKIITEIFAPLIGIGRMVWYVNMSIVFLFPAVIRMSNDRMYKLLLTSITIIYCLIYSYTAYFGDSFRSEYMLPYKFFDLNRME